MIGAGFGPPTLIASDVDGTLLDPSDVIAERTRRVLIRAADAGVELVPSTGRPPRWVPEITDQLAGTSAAVRYAVCANGAIVYDVRADEILYAAELGADVLAEIAEICARVVPG